MYRPGIGYYKFAESRPVEHSIAPAEIFTLAPRGLSGIGCPGLGCPGLGAFTMPDLSSLSSSLPGGVLGLAAAAAGALVLWRVLAKRGGGSKSSALRRARYKAESERAAILAKA